MQFFHIAPYGRKPRPGQPRHATASAILGEAVRRPSSSAHISNPAAPALIYGSEPEALFARLAEIEAVGRDRAGRRLRSDAALMMVAVVSYPHPTRQLDQAEHEAVYSAWKELTVRWLIQHFGNNLTCILEHTDETYPHLHAVLFPTVTVGGQLDWSCHPGRAAKAASAQRGENPGVQDASYRRAMAQLQDNLHQEVSRLFGHERSGPRRARRERHHHLELRTAEDRAQELEAANRALAARLAELLPDQESPASLSRAAAADKAPRQMVRPGGCSHAVDDVEVEHMPADWEDAFPADDWDQDADSQPRADDDDFSRDLSQGWEEAGQDDWDDLAEPDPDWGVAEQGGDFDIDGQS